MKSSQSNNKSILFFIYLTLLSMLCFIATDMYLPAFKNIETSFGVSSADVALSLTTFLAGLSIGQLLYGKLVAKIGNYYSLLLGLGIFIAATVMIVFSENILFLHLGRFLQAIGVCSASVIWQALVIEKYDETESQKVLSNIMPLVALSPALAPLVGSFFLAQWGWQSIFVSLIAIGLVLVVLTQYFVKPSKVLSEEQSDTTVENVSYLSMLKQPLYPNNLKMYVQRELIGF